MTGDAETAIKVRGLVKRFGEVQAVAGIDFDVSGGELFGFLGPNGAGKTTTVRMLTGVLDPSGGTASIQGHDIRVEALLARAHIAVVPEEANVYLDLSVWQNVMLMAELHGVPRQKRVEEGNRLLDLLGLGDRKKQKARALSKGLRQRLMLCTALVTGPEILFLDEPTSGLDVQSARLIRQIVRDMNRDGLTVFMTTHNMEEAGDMCSRIAIINQGRIAAVGTPERLRSLVRTSQYVEVRFEGKVPGSQDLAALSSVSQVEETGSGYRLFTDSPGKVAVQAVKFAEETGLSVAHLCTCKPGLEDIFLNLTAAKSGEAE